MAPRTVTGGVFITFEGPEGCGKSTQSRRLGTFLRKRGFSVLVTREPGGTRLGEAVRRLLLYSRVHLSPLSELFLYELSRSHLVDRVIRPALRRGAIVLSDRFSDSTFVYQGIAGGVNHRFIRFLDRKACREVRPALTLLLDVPVKRGLGRSLKQKGSLDRMERKSLSFHQKVRQGYLSLYRKNKNRIRLIPPGTAASVEKRVQREVRRVLQRRLGTTAGRFVS